MYNFVSKLGKVEICVHMFEWCKMQCSFNEILHQSKIIMWNQICFCFRKVIKFFLKIFFSPTVRPSYYNTIYNRTNMSWTRTAYSKSTSVTMNPFRSCLVFVRVIHMSVVWRTIGPSVKIMTHRHCNVLTNAPVTNAP